MLRTGLGIAASAAGLGGGFLGSLPVARAQSTGAKVRLILQVSWQGGINYTGTSAQALTDKFIADNWTAKHPGVEVITQVGEASNCYGGGCGLNPSTDGNVAAILAGEGPDVMVTYEPFDLVNAGLIRPLDEWLRRDDINAQALFPETLLSGMTYAGQLFALPDYGSPGPLYVNYTLLDQLGLRYPAPDWTYLDAEHLWRQIAGSRHGQWLYGSSLTWGAAWGDWLIKGFGGRAMDPSGTRCLLNQPAAIRAYEWFAPLVVDKIVSNAPLGAQPQVILSNQAAFVVACCGSIPVAVSVLGDKIKWDVVPLPSFPVVNTNNDGNGSYAMSAVTKNPPELVWNLYKFVTTTFAWQRFFNARLAFAPPPMLPEEIWADWEEIVRAAAPVLKTKNLEVFHQASKSTVDGFHYFKYASNQANGIWGKYEDLMLAGKMSVVSALDEMTRQINVLESEAARSTAIVETDLAGIRASLAGASRSTRPVTFPVPPSAGEGIPFSRASAGDVVVRNGTYAVSGSGQMAGSDDNGTYACGVGLSSRATYSCRLVSLTPAAGQMLKGGTKVGLMVRGDLSDNAVMLWLGLDGGNGLHSDYRAFFGDAQQHRKSGSGLSLPGDLASIVTASKKPLPNWLARPLWLRWDRAVDTWTSFASTDGIHWTKTGGSIGGLPLAGCWVGLFACNKNSSRPVRAVFDHVSGFDPHTFVVLGGG